MIQKQVFPVRRFCDWLRITTWPHSCLQNGVWRGRRIMIPHFPLLFNDNPASRTSVISIPNTVFFPKECILCQDFGESRFQRWAVKSSILSSNFACSLYFGQIRLSPDNTLLPDPNNPCKRIDTSFQRKDFKRKIRAVIGLWLTLDPYISPIILKRRSLVCLSKWSKKVKKS